MDRKDLLVWVTKRGNLEWSRFTEPYIRYYCERHGYDLIFADIGHTHNVATSWTKCKAFRYVNAPMVLFMDLDFFPLPDAPAIHEHMCNGVLNLAVDEYLIGPTGRKAERQYNLPDDSMRFNCGLIGVPMGYSKFWDNIYELRDQERNLWWEQSEVNLAIYRDCLEVNLLSTQWNRFVKEKSPGEYDKVADLIFGSKCAYFLHLCGHANKDALAHNIDREIREVIGAPWPQADEGLERPW